MKIADLLSSGRKNAVYLRNLCDLTGLDGRTVRHLINAERLAGVPIVSDSHNGYYIASSEEEKRDFVRGMRSRAKAINKTAKAVERAEIDFYTTNKETPTEAIKTRENGAQSARKGE